MKPKQTIIIKNQHNRNRKLCWIWTNVRNIFTLPFSSFVIFWSVLCAVLLPTMFVVDFFFHWFLYQIYHLFPYFILLFLSPYFVDHVYFFRQFFFRFVSFCSLFAFTFQCVCALFFYSLVLFGKHCAIYSIYIYMNIYVEKYFFFFGWLILDLRLCVCSYFSEVQFWNWSYSTRFTTSLLFIRDSKLESCIYTFIFFVFFSMCRLLNVFFFFYVWYMIIRITV